MDNSAISNVSAVLAEVIDAKRLLTGSAIGADYAHDELPGGAFHAPELVCVAESTEEVSAVLKACHEAGVPVTVRGAGTGQVGGSVPIQGGVVLSTGNMKKVLGFDEAAKTLTVQSGVLLQDVKAEAEKNGLYYPPDPGEKTATIGGNAATDAAGPDAVKYGTTRDYVADAVIVLADGTVAKLSDKAEYAAVLGSEGTLAVITELTLKLAEKPATDVILLLPFADIETALAAPAQIMASDLASSVSIVEFMDTDVVEFSGKVTGNPLFPVEIDGDRVAATLMVTLEGADDDDLDEKMEAIAELSEELECLDILVVDTPTMKRDTWAAHDAFHTSMESGAKCAYEVNVNVPMEGIAELVGFSKELGEGSGLKVLAYAHAASGGVHIHAVSDDAKETFFPAAEAFAKAVYEKCAALGGDIVGEYGVGYAKKDILKAVAAERQAACAAAKAALDPTGILNPGKIV